MADSGNRRWGTTFLVFGLCGLASVALDMDHVLYLLWRGIPITWENLARHASRPLHIPFLLVACAGSIVSGALLTGWALIDASTNMPN